jgi:hypothetical protein
MVRKLTIADIITNAYDKNYSLEQAAIDLGELINELEYIKRRYYTDSPRFIELKSIIPAQEKLALGKLQGDQLFAQLEQLAKKLEKLD